MEDQRPGRESPRRGGDYSSTFSGADSIYQSAPNPQVVQLADWRRSRYLAQQRRARRAFVERQQRLAEFRRALNAWNWDFGRGPMPQPQAYGLGLPNLRPSDVFWKEAG